MIEQHKNIKTLKAGYRVDEFGVVEGRNYCIKLEIIANGIHEQKEK